MTRRAYGLVISAFIAGCSGNGPSTSANPAAPTSPSPTLANLTVTSASGSATTMQLLATARFSDGTSRDVTTTARWESSNTSVAIVSAGLVTIVASGDAEVRASYWGVTGSLPLHIPLPPPRLALQGTVFEVPPDQRARAGARVQIMVGPDAGKVALSDSTGAYAFGPLNPGVLIVRTTLEGYQPWEVGFTLFTDRREDMWLSPVPPKDANGATASARCKDGTWSWSLDVTSACAANGGIAYFVCPGPFCDRAARVR